MFLKDHLKEIYYNASLDNDTLTKESIVRKWVHRFGFNSLNDLLLKNKVLKNEKYEEVNQKEINFKFSENPEYQDKVYSKPINKNTLQITPSINKHSQTYEDIEAQELPLPNIDKLRKWIKNNKEAS